MDASWAGSALFSTIGKVWKISRPVVFFARPWGTESPSVLQDSREILLRLGGVEDKEATLVMEEDKSIPSPKAKENLKEKGKISPPR